MQKMIVSTTDLPAEIDDELRFKTWHETFRSRFGPAEMWQVGDDRFHGEWVVAPFKETMLGYFNGSPISVARTKQQASTLDGYTLTFNFASPASALLFSFPQADSEAPLAKGQAVLFRPGEAWRCEPAQNCLSYRIPSRTLHRLVPNADDLSHMPIDGSLPAMVHLRRYLGMLLADNGMPSDPALQEHVETTLLDLVALSIGGQRDAVALAHTRGLRAARCSEVLAEIRKDFADPAFSIQRVAARIGVSPNYVQKLLAESGLSFSERVLELRLQKALSMLTDRRNDRLKVSDIALACGFNEVSYFNRCFRRRFGETPTSAR
ncbi:MAG: AraC family transcriptional regulator [Bradyrhizobium sp.]|nr:AraC family transcriptional regulator [Bradyrhizobium sp.]